MPWQFTDKWVQLERALNTPVCTGEDIYLLDGFEPLLAARAVTIVHPDLATSGGIVETKKIRDHAQACGVSMAPHTAGTPVGTLASVRCAAATETFVAPEHPFDTVASWGAFVGGVPKPIIRDGHVPVPEGPGLGFELNPDVVREHLDPSDRGFFEPTPDRDEVRGRDRLWS